MLNARPQAARRKPSSSILPPFLAPAYTALPQLFPLSVHTTTWIRTHTHARAPNLRLAALRLRLPPPRPTSLRTGRVRLSSPELAPVIHHTRPGHHPPTPKTEKGGFFLCHLFAPPILDITSVLAGHVVAAAAAAAAGNKRAPAPRGVQQPHAPITLLLPTGFSRLGGFAPAAVAPCLCPSPEPD
ncbi:hypothetical protein FZEAL_9221 [Fusarium zealandicum]|uniref:Uncharacterized protein n=1 Tax=Fusarium zealandicum TaxID=1053134 RepID=A0A8H4XG14_9HYPO|nr:hypothetical protein FZEAL_9221 [Fusarium zealandicum]